MEEPESIEPMKLSWRVKRGSEVEGPMGWEDVVFLVRANEIDRKDHIRSELDEDWIQVSDYPDFSRIFSKKDKNDMYGIKPDGTDAVFLFGMFVFFVGAVVFFFSSTLGIVVMGLSLILEIGGIIYSFKYKPQGRAKVLGNIFAIIWICFQAMASIFIILIYFS